MANPNPDLRVLATRRDAATGPPAEKTFGAAAQNPTETTEPAWLSVTDAAERLGVPARRLRRYLDRHASAIETRRTGRKHLVAERSMATLARIRDLYREGATAQDVDQAVGARVLAARPARSSEQIQESRALTNAVLTAAAAKQLVELEQQVEMLRGQMAEMSHSLEQRDRVLRRALMAMVDLFQYNENERQLAERERDRDTAHYHQRVMLAMQELLMHARKRRRRWF